MASITVYITGVQSSNIAFVSYSAWHPLQYTFPGFKIQIQPLFRILHVIHYSIHFQGSKFKYNLCFIYYMASITEYISRVQSSNITCFLYYMASITEYNSRVQSSNITCFKYYMASFTVYISKVQSSSKSSTISQLSLTKQKQAILIISLCCVLYTCSTWDGC